MSYNRKAITDALSKMNKARKPKQPKDIIKDPEGQYKYPGVPTRIASDNITMQGVPFPVLGVDNLGNQQLMLPGAEYVFPGADYVDEFPMMQGGGTKGNPPPTYADSLYLYNNAIAKESFYRNNPNYQEKKSNISFTDPKTRARLISEARDLRDYKITQQQVKEHNSPSKYVGEQRFKSVKGTGLTSFGDIVSYEDNPFLLNRTPYADTWFNPSAPPVLLHPNITPQGAKKYVATKGSNYGDESDIPYYDPIAVKPGDMLTDKELAIRIQKYGEQGIPLNKIEQYRAIVAKQEELIAAGYKIGKPDGIWGPKSEAAWIEYQNKVENQPTETSAQPNPTSGVPPLDVAPIDNPVATPQTLSSQGSQQPSNTPQQASAAPQQPSGYNVWTHNGQPLDPAVYGWAPSDSPRQISQFADTHSLKRANEAYTKLNATPWATEGNKLLTDLSKPYFTKAAATNALAQTAEQLGVPVDQLEIVKAPAGYSGYVVIQNLPQQKYGGLVTELTNTSGNLLMSEQGKRMMAQSGSLSATNKMFLGNPMVTKRKKSVFVPGAPFQEGGNPSDPGMDAMMKARFAYAHMHGNPAAQRMTYPVDNPYIFTGTEPYTNPDMAGEFGTHYMFSQDNYAVPTIQQDEYGNLIYNPEANYTNPEAIQFDRPEDAEYFAEYYKQIAPGMQTGGSTDWKSRIASAMNFQKGGQLFKEEFEKRKAAYKKMTGRDFEPPKSFKPTQQSREYYQNRANQQPVVQTQPSETTQQSRGVDTRREKEIVEAQANTDAKAAENYMHFYNKTYGSDYGTISYEQALQKVKLPGFDKAKYLNMYNLGQPKNEQLQSFREADQANRTWEIITNPFTAFEYAVATGDMANMPSNINAARMQGYDIGVTPGRNMVGNALNMTTNLFDAGDKVIRNVGEGNYLGAGLEAMRFLPGARFHTGLGKQTGKYLTQGPLKNAYNKVATGESFIPYAWKSPAVGLSEEASQNMFKEVLNSGKLTDAERAIVADYQYNSRLYTGRSGNVDPVKRQAINDIIKKYNINVNNDAIATRMFNPTNNSLGANITGSRLNFGDRPTSFTIGAKGSYGSGATDRIVIPNRYLKQMGDKFVKNTYEPLSEEALKFVPEDSRSWAAGIGVDNAMLGRERELIGSGLDFRKIGKVKNDVGGYDWIVKPITPRQLPGSGNAGYEFAQSSAHNINRAGLLNITDKDIANVFNYVKDAFSKKTTIPDDVLQAYNKAKELQKQGYISKKLPDTPKDFDKWLKSQYNQKPLYRVVDVNPQVINDNLVRREMQKQGLNPDNPYHVAEYMGTTTAPADLINRGRRSGGHDELLRGSDKDILYFAEDPRWIGPRYGGGNPYYVKTFADPLPEGLHNQVLRLRDNSQLRKNYTRDFPGFNINNIPSGVLFEDEWLRVGNNMVTPIIGNKGEKLRKAVKVLSGDEFNKLSNPFFQQGGPIQPLDYFDTELTDQEIEQYKKGGCVVVKL